jgi:hypothetical protein
MARYFLKGIELNIIQNLLFKKYYAHVLSINSTPLIIIIYYSKNYNKLINKKNTKMINLFLIVIVNLIARNLN